MALYTAERTNPESRADNPIFQRHLFAYQQAMPYINGQVLELGSGTGYGLQHLAPLATHYTALDKYAMPLETLPENVRFVQKNIPPFPFDDATFDVLVSFQVLEHIEEDAFFVAECARVLKPNGLVILTTPNIKMSLTRNPWHVREYTPDELTGLMKSYFDDVSMLGIFGEGNAMAYFEKNRRFVEKITRLDVFNLQYKLPRRILQIPYDVLNRINRLALKKADTTLTETVTVSDFRLRPATETCFDLFCIARKSKIV